MATTIEELQVLITAKTSGLQKEIGKVKSTMQGAQKATDSVTKAIEGSTKVTPIFKNRMSQLTAELENTNSKLELQKAKLEELKSEGAGLNESAITQMQKLERESANLDSQIRDLTSRITELKEQQKDALGDFHKGMIGDEIRQYEKQLSSLILKADETGFKMVDLQDKMDLDTRKHESEIVKTEGSILRLQQRIDSINESIRKMQELMYGNADSLKETREEMNKVSKSVNNMGNQFTRAFKRIARQVLIFAVIYKGLRSLQIYLRDSMKTNQDFMSSLNNLRANLLIAFQPIYDVIVPALTKLIQTLARATQYVAAFISGLFGRTYSESMKAAQGLQTARKAMDAYGESARKAAGLAGFDELNLIGGDSASDDAEGGVDFGALADEQDIGALDRVSQAMAKVSEKAKEMAEKVKESYGALSGFISEHSDIIIAALAGVGTALGIAFGVAKWGSIVAFVQRAATAIGAAIAAIGWPITLTVAAIAALVGGFTYFYRTNEKFRNTVQSILSKIGEVAMWLWENVMKPFGAWLVDAMPKAWGAVVKGAEWLWKKVLVPFGNFLKWLWDNVLVPIGNVLKDLLGVAFKHVADIAQDFWKKVLVPLGKALKEMLEPAVEAVSAVLSFLWNKVLKPLGTYLGKVLKPIILAIIDVFEFLWKHVLRPLVDFVGGTLRSVFSNVFDALGGIINGLKDIFIGLMSFITGVFTGDWKKAWEGVKQIFKGVFDSLWDIVKAPLNMIIDSINTMIGGLNKISFDIPDRVPGLGGKTFGINIPKIPRLAIGTDYVARDGLAYLHQGEAVVPADVASGGFSGGGEVVDVLRDILQAVREDRTVQAVISQKEVARASRDGINHQQRRTGRTQLQV